jgi:hypothetical protein
LLDFGDLCVYALVVVVDECDEQVLFGLEVPSSMSALAINRSWRRRSAAWSERRVRDGKRGMDRVLVAT